MTAKEKTEYTRIGLAFVNIGVNDLTAELIWRMVEMIQKKKGRTTLSDACQIRAAVEKRYEVKLAKPKIGSEK